MLDRCRICVDSKGKIRYGGAGKVQVQTPRMTVRVESEDLLEIVSISHKPFAEFCQQFTRVPLTRLRIFDGECEWFGEPWGPGNMYDVAMIWTFESVSEQWGLRVRPNQVKVYRKVLKRPLLFCADDETTKEEKVKLFLVDDDVLIDDKAVDAMNDDRRDQTESSHSHGVQAPGVDVHEGRDGHSKLGNDVGDRRKNDDGGDPETLVGDQ